MKFIDAKTNRIIREWRIVPKDGKEYFHDDYRYSYVRALEGWRVSVLDNKKEEYGLILESIAGKPIVSLALTFVGCRSLKNAPLIPKSVRKMNGAFLDCRELTMPPVIPEDMEDMSFAFSGCVSLVDAPAIPSNVVDMESTFADCRSLAKAPSVPSNVTNLAFTFSCCESLRHAPEIPRSVTNMEGTFEHCEALTGSVAINANPQNYDYCFIGVDFADQALVLEGRSNMLAELVKTGKNYRES